MAKTRSDLLNIDLGKAHEVDLIADAENLIAALMKIKSVSRSDLAKRMGVSRVRVHQILKSNPNITLKTLSQVFVALDEKVKLQSPTLEKRNLEHSQECWRIGLEAGLETKSILAADFRKKVLIEGDLRAAALLSESGKASLDRDYSTKEFGVAI